MKVENQSLSTEGSGSIRYHIEKEGFYVGQEGEFLLRDSNKKPMYSVRGKILKIMEGKSSLYAMIQTESGLRPGRLA